MATLIQPFQQGPVDQIATTTPLASGATYTSDWVNSVAHSSLIVTLLTDQDSTLFVDFSVDATNVDSTLSYAVTANINEVHRIAIARRYFRIRITNTSATPQTFLRTQFTLGEFTILTSPLNTAIQQDADSITARTIESELSIVTGKLTGYSVVNKSGKNPDVDTATVPEDVWGVGGVYTGFPDSTLETVEALSSSALDAAAGTGARTISITGLDANYNVISETITLNGVTPVASTQQFRRVHTARVVTAGSGGVNAGIITVRHSTTEANVFLDIQIGINQSNCSAYTVPAGFTAYMVKLYAVIRGGNTAALDGGIWTRTFGEVFRQRRPFSVPASAPWVDNIYGGVVFTEKSDIVIRITASSANNVDVVAGYDLILVKN